MTGPPPTAGWPRGNPNHAVASEKERVWHKLCALAMFKLGVTSLEISSEDIHRFFASGRANIVVHPSEDVCTLQLVTDAEAERLVREKRVSPL